MMMRSFDRARQAPSMRTCPESALLLPGAIVLLAWAMGQGALLGQADPAPEPTSPVKALVEQLGTDNFEARERATAALIALGEAAHGELQTLRESLGLEVRLRIDAILAHRDSKEVAVVLEPRRITLDLKDCPLDEALASFGRAAGVVIKFANSTSQAGPARIHFQLEQVPLLRALDMFCDAHKWHYNRDHRTGDILLYPRGAAVSGLITYLDLLRIEATAYSTSLHTNFRSPATSRANLQVRIDAEPNAPIIGILQPIRDATGKDQDGNTLSFPVQANMQRYLQSFAGQSRVHLSLTLDPPAETATLLREVTLPLDVVVPEVIVESLCLDPRVMDATAPEIGPLALRIEAILRHNDHQELRLSHATLKAEGPDLLRLQPTYERIELRDVRGQELKSEVIEVAAMENGRMRRGFRLPKDTELGAVSIRMMTRYRIVRWTANLPDLPIK